MCVCACTCRSTTAVKNKWGRCVPWVNVECQSSLPLYLTASTQMVRHTHTHTHIFSHFYIIWIIRLDKKKRYTCLIFKPHIQDSSHSALPTWTVWWSSFGRESESQPFTFFKPSCQASGRPPQRRAAVLSWSWSTPKAVTTRGWSSSASSSSCSTRLKSLTWWTEAQSSGTGVFFCFKLWQLIETGELIMK